MCLVGVDVPAQAPGWFERSKSSTVDTFESTWAIDDDNSLFLVTDLGGFLTLVCT